MSAEFDVVIVGAGIAGISLAWHLNRKGKSVCVLEKSAQAEGASVRNFGMIWVIGQANEEIENLAGQSLEFWKEASSELGFWFKQSGSLHLAYHPLEWQVLKEYASSGRCCEGRKLLGASEVSSFSSQVKTDGLLGALYSPTEGCVDPREVVHCGAKWLVQKGVKFCFDSMVTSIRSGVVSTSDGQEFHGKKIVVCPGPDLFSLYPGHYEKVGLYQTVLQMMRLRPKNNTENLGIHLCAGLTLGHYGNFKNCPSLPDLIEAQKQMWKTQMHHGIHVLVSEHSDGTLTVGDSHAYGRQVSPYSEESIDDAILEALNQFIDRENYDIIHRWRGTYNTHKSLPYWVEEIEDSVIALNLFGTGMTLSFGVTSKLSEQLFAL